MEATLFELLTCTSPQLINKQNFVQKPSSAASTDARGERTFCLLSFVMPKSWLLRPPLVDMAQKHNRKETLWLPCWPTLPSTTSSSCA